MQRSHAWIIGFAPAEAPQYAVAVILKGTTDEISAGTGGKLAGPIAKTVLDYLFANYIKPVRDFGDAWLTRLANEGRIKPVSVTLIYFLMTHGAGGMFALPALTKRLGKSEKKASRISIEEQAESAVSVFFDGLLPR